MKFFYYDQRSIISNMKPNSLDSNGKLIENKTKREEIVTLYLKLKFWIQNMFKFEIILYKSYYNKIDVDKVCLV